MNFTEVFGKANWIGTGNDADIPLIFQRFEARRGEAAEITVLGFGVFILYINGVRVHKEECLPLASDFEASDFPSGEKLNHRAYVEKFDISPYLVDGENMLSILLGNGWYNKPIWEESFGDGNKKAAYRIVFADGREVVSSTDAKWIPSRVTDSHYNKGEVWDMRIDDEAARLPGYNGEERPVVIEADLRESEYNTTDCPRDIIHRTLPATPVYSCDEYTIYDIGINTTGYPHVEVNATRGETVEILFSEDLDNKCELIFFTNKAQLYRAKAADFDPIKASALGEYLPAKLNMDEDEIPILMKALKDYDPAHNVVFVFENGKAVRIPMDRYQVKTNRRRQTAVFSGASPVVAAVYEESPRDIMLIDSQNRKLLIKSDLIPLKSTRTSTGGTVMTLKPKQKVASVEFNFFTKPVSAFEKCRKTKLPSPGVLPRES